MPTVNILILRAWRHADEHGRIHFAVRRANGDLRHLYVDEGRGLYDVLEEHLADQGYTGPASAMTAHGG